MQPLSIKKQMLIIKLYFQGLSYDQIAAKAGVGKGTVVNVITELKAGYFPELISETDQIDMLRELAVDLKHSKLTPIQSAIGIAILSRLNEIKVEPGDIEGLVSLCNKLTTESIDLQSFVKAALGFEETMNKTGLTVDELELKVKTLESTANQLEPMVKQLKASEKQLKDLGEKKDLLTTEVSKLQQNEKALKESIESKEQREEELSSRVIDLEERAHNADERLTCARKDLKSLSGIGISLEELTGFTQRLKGMAHKHGINPKDLNKRLLNELEELDKGLGIEEKYKVKQLELSKANEELGKRQEDLRVLKITNQQLKEERSCLQSTLTDERKHIISDIRAIKSNAKDTVEELKEKLKEGIDQDLKEVLRIKNEALKLGNELGKYEGVIETNKWIGGLLTLVKSEKGVSANEVRVISLTVLRSISEWFKQNYENDMSLYLLKGSINSAVLGLEQWKPE